MFPNSTAYINKHSLNNIVKTAKFVTLLNRNKSKHQSLKRAMMLH